MKKKKQRKADLLYEPLFMTYSLLVVAFSLQLRLTFSLNGLHLFPFELTTTNLLLAQMLGAVKVNLNSSGSVQRRVKMQKSEKM